MVHMIHVYGTYGTHDTPYKQTQETWQVIYQ